MAVASQEGPSLFSTTSNNIACLGPTAASLAKAARPQYTMALHQALTDCRQWCEGAHQRAATASLEPPDDAEDAWTL